jgi:flagellin-like protein
MMCLNVRSLEIDEKAVSPVIGVIMLIALVVIIAAVVTAFAYGIIEGAKKTPNVALVVEGLNTGTNVTVRIFHHGGDTISGAYTVAMDADPANKWAGVQVRINGATVSSVNADCMWKNGVGCNEANWTASFTPGDLLTIRFKSLNESGTLTIVHQPTDRVLLRKGIT